MITPALLRTWESEYKTLDKKRNPYRMTRLKFIAMKINNRIRKAQ